MDKPVSPCSPACEARRVGCHGESCPYGWGQYERDMNAWRAWRADQMRAGDAWRSGSPMTPARRKGLIRTLKRKKRGLK